MAQLPRLKAPRRLVAGALQAGAWKLLELGEEELAKHPGADAPPDPQTTLGFRFKKEVFDCSSAVASELKGEARAFSEELLAAGRPHLWLKTTGIMEWGTDRGVSGVLPIGGYTASVGAGGALSGAVLYEQQHAYEVSPEMLPKVLEARRVTLPITPAAALALHRGAGASFVAQGTLKGMATGGVGPQVGVESLRLSASGSIEVKVRGEGLLRLDLDRLAGTKVRVKVSEVAESAGDLGVELRLGLSLKAGMDPNIVWGAGVLQKILEKPDQPEVTSWMDRLSALDAKASLAVGKLWKELDSWVIDLTTPAGKTAFAEMFQGSTVRAEAYAKIPESGVTHASLKESRSQLRASADVRLFGQKVLLHKFLRQRSSAVLTSASRDRMEYEEDEIARTHSKIAAGTRELKLRTVTIRESRGAQPKTFFQLTSVHHDLHTEQREVDEFLGMARALGCEEANGFEGRIRELKGLQSLISKDDDTTQSIELFITENGIQDIDKCKFAEAREAFLDAALQLDPTLAEDFPMLADKASREDLLAVLRAYIDVVNVQVAPWLRNATRTVSCGFLCGARVDDLKTRYHELTGRFTLDADARELSNLIRGADAFGARVENLVVGRGKDARSRRNVSQFFQRAGFEHGSQLRHSIAALAKIAGPEDVFVHALKLKTASWEFAAKDEGTIDYGIDEQIEQELDRAS